MGEPDFKGRYRTIENLLSPDDKEERLAFSFSGGGAAGAYEAGVLEALMSHELRPDLLVGTSAGALNAFGQLIGMMGLVNRSIERENGSFALDVWQRLDADHRGAELVLEPVRLWKLIRGQSSLLEMLILFLQFGIRLALTRFRILFLLRQLVRPAIFNMDPLGRFLSGFVKTGGNPLRPDQVGEVILREWYGVMDNSEKKPPEMIVTATDITLKTETLFTLARPKTFADLVLSGWMVIQFVRDETDERRYLKALEERANERGLPLPAAYACFTAAENLMEGILSSASIPAGFPARLIPFTCAGRSLIHAFVDGGVVNNAPVHVAVDAGAERVISIELGTLSRKRPSELTLTEGDLPSAVMNLINSFMTAKELSTENDISGAARVNRRIMKGAGTEEPKRLVHLFRHAPAPSMAWTVDFLDFNGKHEKKARANPVISLTEWAEYGRLRAEGRAGLRWGDFAPNYPNKERPLFDGKHYLTEDGPFWEATLNPYPPAPSSLS